MEDTWSKLSALLSKVEKLEGRTSFTTQRDLLLYLFSRDYKRLKSFHQLNEYNLIETLFRAYHRYERLGQMAGAAVSVVLWNSAARQWRGLSKLLMTALCVHYGGDLWLRYNIHLVFQPAERLLRLRHNPKT